MPLTSSSYRHAWTMLKSALVVQLHSRFGRIGTSVWLNWGRPTPCDGGLCPDDFLDRFRSDGSEPLIEIDRQQWHTAPHESVRTTNNATSATKTTSAIDACDVGVNCVNCAVAGVRCADAGAAAIIGRHLMSNLSNKSDSELRETLQASRQTIAGLIDSLTSRPDMREAIHILMRPYDMRETFSELAVKRQRRHTMSEIPCACALLVTPYKSASSLTGGPCASAVQIANSPCPAASQDFCPALRNGTFALFPSGDRSGRKSYLFGTVVTADTAGTKPFVSPLRFSGST